MTKFEKIKYFFHLLKPEIGAGLKDFAVASLAEVLVWVLLAVITFLFFGFWCNPWVMY